MGCMSQRNDQVLVSRAIEVAAVAHRDQLRRSGRPYILHPLRVMLRMRTPLEQIVAVLHDIVEETEVSFEQLRADGFPAKAIEAIQILTHDKRESYDTYIDRIAHHPLARRVKLADLEDNLNSLELPRLTDKDMALIAKYHRTWHRLNSDIKE